MRFYECVNLNLQPILDAGGVFAELANPVEVQAIAAINQQGRLICLDDLAGYPQCVGAVVRGVKIGGECYSFVFTCEVDFLPGSYTVPMV